MTVGKLGQVNQSKEKENMVQDHPKLNKWNCQVFINTEKYKIVLKL